MQCDGEDGRGVEARIQLKFNVGNVEDGKTTENSPEMDEKKRNEE